MRLLIYLAWVLFYIVLFGGIGLGIGGVLGWLADNIGESARSGSGTGCNCADWYGCLSLFGPNLGRKFAVADRISHGDWGLCGHADHVARVARILAICFSMHWDLRTSWRSSWCSVRLGQVRRE